VNTHDRIVDDYYSVLRADRLGETRRLVTAHERGDRKFSTESDGTPKHRKLTLSF
jgi:hypothetical protein